MTPPVFRITRQGAMVVHQCARCPYYQAVPAGHAHWARHKVARDGHDCGGGK